MKYIFLADTSVGILMMVLAVPMILQRVRPNIWYGIRTRKTLSDETVWYPANQYAGKALLLAGSVMAVGGVVLQWAVSRAAFGAVPSESLLSVLGLILLTAPILAALIASLVQLRRL
jgi:uncharacterized membrane protein